VAKKTASDEGQPVGEGAGGSTGSPKRSYPGVNQLDLNAAMAEAKSDAAKSGATADVAAADRALEKLKAQLGITPGKPTFIRSLSDPHRQAEITSIGWGLRYTQGSYSHEKVLKVTVTDKLRESDIHPEQLVPKSVDGFATDVEEVSAGRAHQAAAQYPLPVQCGVACGNEGGTEIGTIGCMVLLKNGNLCFLSNNHILANATGDLAPPRANVRDRVFQPGNRGANLIGVLDDYVPFSSTQINLADAAVALTTDDAVDPRHMTYTLNPQWFQPNEVQLVNLNVLKNGMMTGPSVGTIVGYPLHNVPIDYQGYGRVYFDEIISIMTLGPNAFSQPGDSGSLIVEVNSKRPIGLLVGGAMGRNGPITYANPIWHVIDKLDIGKIISSPDDLAGL